MANGNGEKDKAARELTSISVTLFPEYQGETTIVEKRYGDGKNKFSITVPLVGEDELEDIYPNLSTAKFRRLAISQYFYGENNVSNMLKEQREKGVDPATLIDAVQKEMIDYINSVKAERTSETKELKALKGELKGLGMSPAEAIAMLKELKGK